MKRLTLVRHAKSSWAAPASPDHDRELAERGQRDLRVMGRRLVARKARPSLIISSSAARAAATARSLATALGYPAEFLQLDERLYLAAPEDILAVVAEQDDAVSDLMLFGHNPGLTDLTNLLLPELRLDNLPTCGAVAIEFTTDAWSDIAPGNARLAYFDYPKNPEILLIED